MFIPQDLKRVSEKYPCKEGYTELTKTHVGCTAYERVNLQRKVHILAWEDDGRIMVIDWEDLTFWVDPAWFVARHMSL